MCRWHLNSPSFSSLSNVQPQVSLNAKSDISVFSRKKNLVSVAQQSSNEEEVVREKTSRTPKRGRKKAMSETPENNSIIYLNSDFTSAESVLSSASSADFKKPLKKPRRKAVSASTIIEGKNEKKVRRPRKITKKVGDPEEDQGSDSELSDHEEPAYVPNLEDEVDRDLEFKQDGENDISASYSWPPLVCCFGSAQHAFVPSGRAANRLIDYEIHERMKGAFWAPPKFVRAPGGSSSSVAVALAALGGRVEFMGKLGDDDYGQTMLYYLNMSKVQTRSVCVDNKRVTAVSQMKIGKRGGLKMTCVKQCAEDSLLKTEINIDVLKEARMFYFNTSALLDQNMRSTTLQAIKIAKKLGSVIFYDVNLPLPLWHSVEETKSFLQSALNLADVIEVTKQELEFLCGIQVSDNFDTQNNDSSKFVHYEPELVAPIWHEGLKVLFVTNGTSKIHYYTVEHNGAVHGMEDAPITPLTCDMSASGDGIVAALMRMLTVQPHLITEKGYLERAIKYAIDCGVIDQWILARQRGFPPNDEFMEEELIPDTNGIRTITEMEYRTVGPVS